MNAMRGHQQINRYCVIFSDGEMTDIIVTLTVSNVLARLSVLDDFSALLLLLRHPPKKSVWNHAFYHSSLMWVHAHESSLGQLEKGETISRGKNLRVSIVVKALPVALKHCLKENLNEAY